MCRGGLRTIQDLWAEPLRGRVEVLTEMRDTIALIMLDAGVDISSESWGDDEFSRPLMNFNDGSRPGIFGKRSGSRMWTI
jgi:hypothetical protein